MKPYEFLGGKFRIRLTDDCWIIDQHKTRHGDATWQPIGYYVQLEHLVSPITRLVGARSRSPLPEALKKGLDAAEAITTALHRDSGGDS